MNSFTLRLLDSTRDEKIDGVVSFVGEDGSGSFGLLAGHARALAVLEPGLSRYRRKDQPWQYLATPGAVVYFADNQLTLSTRLCIAGDDAEEIGGILQRRLEEESQLQFAIENLRQMEQDMLKRMWELNRGHAGGPGSAL